MLRNLRPHSAQQLKMARRSPSISSSVAILCERELLDEERTGGVEHLALAEREVLVELQEVEVAQQRLRDFEDAAGLGYLLGLLLSRCRR